MGYLLEQDPRSTGIFESAGERKRGRARCTRSPGIKRTWYQDGIISGQVREEVPESRSSTSYLSNNGPAVDHCWSTAGSMRLRKNLCGSFRVWESAQRNPLTEAQKYKKVLLWKARRTNVLFFACLLPILDASKTCLTNLIYLLPKIYWQKQSQIYIRKIRHACLNEKFSKWKEKLIHHRINSLTYYSKWSHLVKESDAVVGRVSR